MDPDPSGRGTPSTPHTPDDRCPVSRGSDKAAVPSSGYQFFPRPGMNLCVAGHPPEPYEFRDVRILGD